MLVFRFGKFIVPTNFVNDSKLVGSVIRTKASPQPLAVSLGQHTDYKNYYHIVMKLNTSLVANYAKPLLIFFVLLACQQPKTVNTKKSLDDLEIRITKMGVNDTFLSGFIMVYGEVEILSNFDSITISLDTTNDKIKEEEYSKPGQQNIWNYYKSHYMNYTDSVNELISVRNLELINKKKSYGSFFDAYDPTGKEYFRLLKKGVYKKYYFKGSYSGDREFDSVSFEIDYKKNGKVLRKQIGKHR